MFAKKKTTILSAAVALALALGAAHAQDGASKTPPAGPAPKTPHRKWQDVPQPPLDKIPDPKPVVMTLKNGMKLFLLEDHELPTIDISLLSKGGEMDLYALNAAAGDKAAAAARAKAGLASICGEVMRSGGTESKTGDQLDEELDDMAASVGTSVGDQQASARMSCLAESFDRTLAIFADVLRHPAFRDEKIDLAKKQRMGAIRRRNDNPAGVAGREMSRLLYGDLSPFGWTEEMTTISAIGRDDVVDFYERSFAAAPGKMLLGAVGDFDAKGLAAKLDAALGDWTGAGEAPAAAGKGGFATDGFTGPGPKLYFARKTDVNQATVLFAHPGIQRKPGDPDYPAAVVANSILGAGGFTSRLMQKVRTEMGLAYGCRSAFDASMGHQGTFTMQGQTKSGSTLAMARAMRKELERLVSEEPSADEVRIAKQSILEKLVFSFDRKSDVLDRALRNEFWGFPQNELEVFQQGVAAVTPADCLRVAKKLFDPAKLTTVVVGNDADFDGKLEELGPVTMIELDQGGPRGGRGRRGQGGGAGGAPGGEGGGER